MIGTTVNTLAILAGTAVGATLRTRFPERVQRALYDAMGLVTLALGAHMAVTNIGRSEYPVLFVLSLALGAAVGVWLDPAGRLGRAAERRGAARLVQGLTTACLLYCIGTLSIVGPVLSAVEGNDTYLYTNATLDFVSSAVFAATYGWGMAWGAAVLFAWQGSIWLAARLLGSAGLIPEALMAELSIVGGCLLLSSGLAILGLKDCKTVNLLPALAVPVLFYLLRALC